VKHVLYMAWRYFAYHRVIGAVLVAAIAAIVFIPCALWVLVGQAEQQLTARADGTPLLLGAKASPLELSLNSLYFAADAPDPIPYAEVDAIRDSGLAHAIPLYVRYRSQDAPIVGTSLDYFDFRGLRVERGRPMVRLGECVIGAVVARGRSLGPGESIVSSPVSAFDLAGVYPLKMRVVGVLAPTGGPDDQAVFVDVRTAWVIEGLAHGHDDLTRPEAASGVLRREGSNIVANASVRQYQEVTDDNLDSFHFHGDTADFPITAVIGLPPDQKSEAILLGRFQTSETRQLVRPVDVVDELLATVFTVRDVVVAALMFVAGATLLLVLLVFTLSMRLRRAEIETMHKIGGSPARVGGILLSEILGTLGAGAVLGLGLVVVAGVYGPRAVQAFLSI
jgi:putative ABC transport system permease protein